MIEYKLKLDSEFISELRKLKLEYPSENYFNRYISDISKLCVEYTISMGTCYFLEFYNKQDKTISLEEAFNLMPDELKQIVIFHLDEFKN